MKEGEVRDVVHVFQLLCLCQLFSSHHSLLAVAAPSRFRFVFNHVGRLKLVSVTVGVTAGKNLSASARSHHSHHLFHPPLKSFVLFSYRLYSFHEQKLQENQHPE